MVTKNSERIDRIRSKVREERTLLSQLKQQIADDEVKKVLLGPTSLRLDQVEGFFLDQKTLDEPRSQAALSKWLEERELASAIKCRAQAEEAIRKFGPNVKIIG